MLRPYANAITQRRLTEHEIPPFFGPEAMNERYPTAFSRKRGYRRSLRMQVVRHCTLFPFIRLALSDMEQESIAFIVATEQP